jgi:hypothetical protein
MSSHQQNARRNSASSHLLSATPVFTRKSLKQSAMSSQFFNTLFNLSKFIQSEQRDPFRIKQIHDTPQLSDWDRYAIAGYYRLAEVENEMELSEMDGLHEMEEMNTMNTSFGNHQHSEHDANESYGHQNDQDGLSYRGQEMDLDK